MSYDCSQVLKINCGTRPCTLCYLFKWCTYWHRQKLMKTNATTECEIWDPRDCIFSSGWTVEDVLLDERSIYYTYGTAST